MVEYVISIKTELRYVFFRDVEVLSDRQVGGKCMRSSQPVPSRFADMTASGQRERSRSRTGKDAGVVRTSDIRRGNDLRKRVLAQRSHRREPPEVAAGVTMQARAER